MAKHGLPYLAVVVIVFLVAEFSTSASALAGRKGEKVADRQNNTSHRRDCAPQIHYRFQSILSPRVADRLPEWLQVMLYVPTEFTASEITDDDLRPLLRMPTIAKVIINDSILSRSGMRNLRDLNALKEVDLARTRIDDRAARLLVRHRTLLTISLGGTQVTDETAIALSRLPKLRALWLSGTSIGDHGAYSIAKCQTLREVGLAGTSVSDSGIEAITKLRQLEHITLSNTSITNRSVRLLRKCGSLTSLDISETDVDDGALEDVLAMEQLRVIHLTDTNVSRSAVEFLRNARPKTRVYDGKTGKGVRNR